MQLSFHGGAGMVTGSNFLLEDNGTRILIDCGFFQGCSMCEERNREAFPYDPSTIDFLFVTHAHIDHTGRIPKLVKDGFKGRIISTPPTRDLAKLMLEDSLSVMEEDLKEKRSNVEPIFAKEDIDAAFAMWEGVEYHQPIDCGSGLSAELKIAGHVLGSAMISFSRNKRTFVATGDLGNSPALLLRDTEAITGAHYLLMESVYGDREHEEQNNRRRKFEDVIEETVSKDGALLIPAFSLERTQDILYEIEHMMADSRIPLVPVFLDSPLAIRITEVYRKHKAYFKERVREAASDDGDGGIFRFPQLRMTESVEESKAIFDTPNPKIIIAGSGMSNGGRILHHEKRYLPDEASTLLIVGYQAPGSLGRKIQEGARLVEIMGDEIPVNARIETVEGYSAHMDAPSLMQFVASTSDTLEKAFVVMGEPKSAASLVQRVRDYLGVNAVAPQEGDTVEIDL